MPSLTDYIATETLAQLLGLFCRASGAAVRVFSADSRQELCPLPDASDPPITPRQFKAPVTLQRRVIARVVVSPLARPGADSPAAKAGRLFSVVLPAAKRGGDQPTTGENRRLRRFAYLLAEVLSRLAGQQKQIRARVEELATLYRLTSEFTSRRDLQAVLDLVTQTVVEVLDAKACAIRMLSEDRAELVIKAVANLSPRYLDKGPILVSQSRIDQQVLSDLESVSVDDMRSDKRVVYRREARQEGLVSALCCPMVYKGRPEGVLRIYKAHKHKFDWFEISLAEAIAAGAATAVVNARLYAEAVRLENTQRQLRMAATVQRRMIPAEAPRMPFLDIDAVYVPCFELGGDFYDFIRLGEENLGLAVCDVVGKGVRASLLMASVRASLRAHASNVYELSQVIGQVNADLCADTEINDFATLFYGVVDTATKRFTYVNAGHVPPLLVRDRQARRLTTGGRILGIDPDYAWRHEVFQLQRGDVLLCYTDGLTDAMNFEDESFGAQRVEQAILTAAQTDCDAGGLVKHVLWEMRKFAGLQTRIDDLTMVAVRVL